MTFTGSYDHFDSPQKTSFPSLRNSSSESSLFPSTPSMKPSVQFRNPSFTTPQRRIIDTDFSSGPENQSSPANGDTEDTPEPPRQHISANFGGAMIKFEGSRTHSPEKKHPSSGMFGKFVTPGRGEIARKPHIDAAIRKVHKKRRRDADRDVRLAHRRGGHGYESEELEDRSQSRPRQNTDDNSNNQGSPPYEMGLIPSIFHFIERHPRLPHILCHYAQVLLNFFLVTFCMYIIYSFWSTIKSDVDEKAREAAHEIMAEMVGCTREYKDNKCDSNTRVPALEVVCNNWEKCMKQDPSLVGRASVSAYTFAGVLNSFFEPLHWKTVVSFLSSSSSTKQKLSLPSTDPLSLPPLRHRHPLQPRPLLPQPQNRPPRPPSSCQLFSPTHTAAANGLRWRRRAVLSPVPRSSALWEAGHGGWGSWCEVGEPE